MWHDILNEIADITFNCCKVILVTNKIPIYYYYYLFLTGHYFVPYTPAMPTLVQEDHIQSNQRSPLHGLCILTIFNIVSLYSPFNDIEAHLRLILDKTCHHLWRSRVPAVTVDVDAQFSVATPLSPVSSPCAPSSRSPEFVSLTF